MTKAAFATAWEARETAVLARDEYPLEMIDASELAPFGGDVVEPLIARLDADDVRLVVQAALALECLPAFADAIVPRLVPRLADPHAWIAEAMCWIIHELGAAAMPAMQDAYASQPAHAHAIARALSTLGPGAAAAAGVLREDARTDPAIAAALRAIEGPWEVAPEEPVPYLGEALWLGSEGPSERAYFGRMLALDLLQDKARHDEERWDRAYLDDLAPIGWWPSRIAIAARTATIGVYNWDTERVVTTEITADDGGARGFTNHELLYKALVTQHERGPCNDRIFEGLRLEEEAIPPHYYVKTGS